MKILKNVYVNLVPDSTGTTYSAANVTYQIGTTDDPSISKQITRECPLSIPDETAAQTVFADVVAFVKSQEGL